MARFKVVLAYNDKGIQLPTRATKKSAGYDLASAEDIIIPSYARQLDDMFSQTYKVTSVVKKDKPIATELITTGAYNVALSLNAVADKVKANKLKPTMIPTGLCVDLADNQFLQVQPRSSTGTKYLLTMPSSLGIIDADYIESDNGGHIYIPVLNLTPYDIVIHKGDKIAQGIIQEYHVVENDNTEAERNGGFGSTN